MLELFKAWSPHYQFCALAIVLITGFGVVVVVMSFISRTILLWKHGYPPIPPHIPDEPEPPVFKFSYNGPPEHAPAWARPPKPELPKEPT